MSEFFELQEHVIRSAKNDGEALCYEPVREATVKDLFETYSIGIPIPTKRADYELGRAWCGYLKLPGEETILAFIAHFSDKAIIASKGNVPYNSLILKTDACARFQQEFFKHYWKIFTDQVDLHTQQALGEIDTQHVVGEIEVATSTTPTWGANNGSVDNFDEGVMQQAIRKGIPAAYVNMMFAQSGFRNMLMEFVGEIAEQGTSFIGQQVAAAQFIEACWNRLTDENKAKILEFQALGERVRGLS